MIWQLLSIILGVSQAGVKRVPGLQDIIGAMIQFSGYWPGGLGAGDVTRGAERTIWGAVLGAAYNSWFTLVRVLVGFAFGVIAGVGLGLLVSWSQAARRLFGASAHFLRMMPLLAMMPLFGLWFARSETGTYVFVAFAVAVLLFVITLSAVDGVPEYYVNYAMSLGASKLSVYRSVIIPAALPEIRNGLLLAVPFAWSAVLAAEFIGKQYGLGRILNYAQLYAETDVIAATGLVVVLLAAISFFLVRRYLNYLTRWV
ncbi:ABC transporter permease [Paramicrobacterium humi]|uniref:ABC transporter permease n=1 Tax=Paramicrobacterium humi TaxID=640635 RepID=UPI0015A018CC|nr:ABC transporter permease subunit [Microbacterium humi]